jgi:flagellar basal-body rod modification protein FlgD
MASDPIGDTNPGITYTPQPAKNPASNSSNKSSTSDTLASNFTTFLQLLTTQLQNQSPLDPLDTNQFTQQLVQFAQVEQQLKSNDQLATLVSIQQATQSTQAMAFVGTTVALDGATTPLKDGKAEWTFAVTKPSTAKVTITDAVGQTIYSGSFTVQSGPQAFKWDGRDNTGHQWPDGAYKLSVTAKDTNGQTVAVSTEIEGKVDSVDLTQSPPLLWVNGQTYTVDKIKRVTKPAS